MTVGGLGVLRDRLALRYLERCGYAPGASSWPGWWPV